MTPLITIILLVFSIGFLMAIGLEKLVVSYWFFCNSYRLFAFLWRNLKFYEKGIFSLWSL